MEDRPGEGTKLTQFKRQQQPWNMSNAVRERDITREPPPVYAETQGNVQNGPLSSHDKILAQRVIMVIMCPGEVGRCAGQHRDLY
jgi:hypothetical protein